MELAEFLNSLPKHEREALAGACGTTLARLRQIAYGNEAASPQLCVAVDRESKGVVPYTCVNDAWRRRGGENDGRKRIPMDWEYVERKAISAASVGSDDQSEA